MNSMRKTSAAISTRTSTATTSRSMSFSYPGTRIPTPALRPGRPGRSAAAAGAGRVDPRGIDDAGEHEGEDRDDPSREADLREAHRNPRRPQAVRSEDLNRHVK